VYQTTEGSIHQCDERGVFQVQFFDEGLELKLCGLLSFRRKINNIEITELLEEGLPDLELVYLPYCDRLFAFSVMEILALKDLLDGALTILKINSLIHKETVRKPSYR